MRSVISGLVASLVIAIPLFGIEAAPPHANVYIDGMSGFGSYLAAALRVKEVPVEVVADRRQADFELAGTSESKDPGLAQSIVSIRDRTSGRASA